MASGFNTLGVDMSTHNNYSAEELSKMPTMEQLIASNRIRNQQMLQTLGLKMTPKQRNTTDKKSRKETNRDVNWTPDAADEEDSDNVDTLVRKNSCTAATKSNESLVVALRIKPGTSANKPTCLTQSPFQSLPAAAATTPLSKSAERLNSKKVAQTASLASETDKSISSPNNGHQNHSTRKKDTLGSVSVNTQTEETTPPTAWVQPFTGFTAEQIEAAKQRSVEAQNRKEAIIRLMRAKLLNKDDITIIEPVDRDVQAVLKHRHQEAKEQQKAEQCKIFGGRYPRRNESRKNYHESSEDDEILDQDTTNTFRCDTCKKDYEGHRICPIYHDAVGHLDITELDNRLAVYNVVKSLPEGLLVKESPTTGATHVVYTGQFTSLRKDMIYGPYEGVSVYNEREAHQSGYCWQIYYKRKISHWIDARQVHCSNWLRYINCAATMDQQNVCAYQVGQNIYYRTVVDIGPDTELLVWYGDDYAKELGLRSMAFMASINSITVHGAYLACWDCQLEFRCRQLLNQHKFTAHDTVNSNSVAVVGTTRCVTNNVATRQVRGSVAKSGLLVHKPRVAGSACSAISGVAVSPGCTVSDASDYKQHERYVGNNEGFGVPSVHFKDPVVDKCQVIAGNGGACMPLTVVQSSVGVNRAVVDVTDDGRRVQCSTCCKLFKTREELIQHTLIHSAEKPFECSNCEKRFTKNRYLTRHSRVHSGEKPFECTTCDQRFTQYGHVVRHSLIHTADKPFECTTCGQRFRRNGDLTIHSFIHNGEKPFECTTCGQRFSLKGILKRHCLIHTGEKPFECTACGQRFTLNCNLARHNRVHTGEKPFECTACGLRFKRNTDLTIHSRIHTGEKPFECTACGQRFRQNCELTKHSRIHTGERPFECTACGQRFRRNGDLTVHILIHTGEKPFVCTACCQKFTLNCNLARHSRIHSGERPFECTTCGQKFTQISNLAKHRRMHIERP